MTQTPAWDIVVVGGANFDYLIRGAQLPAAGETIAGQSFQEAPGGKGANQAVAAARLGARVTLVARIGKDERGEQIATRLQAEGVDLRFLIRDPEALTGVALVLVEETGQKQIMTAPGANLRLTESDIQRATSAMASARVLLMPLEVPPACALAAVRLAREANVKVVLDPARPAPLPDELLRLCDVIKPNATEAEGLTGLRVQDQDSARQAAQRLRARGVGAVAIQAGQDGNLLVWPEGERWLPHIPVDSVDATGAGDAFAAALGVALAEGRPWGEAGLFASACAALKTTVLGAQAGLPRREAVEALLAQIR